MENLKSLLHEEIETEFEELSNMELGSDLHKKTVDDLVKLFDRAIEIDKHETAKADKIEERTNEKEKTEYERQLKDKQDREERIWKIVSNSITAAGVIIPVFVTIWGVQKSFEFEKEGTVTTIMGRGFVGKLLPKK